MSLSPRAVARIMAILLVTAGCFPDSTAPVRNGGSFVRVSGINSSGQMAGDGAAGRALLWDAGGTSRDLGVLPNRIQSSATAINDLGHVVGWSDNP